jgi:uncharacterized NAD(P)/FAD-binding protein YdhS
MARGEAPITVIGAGFSGTMTALHLLERVRNRSVLLCERAPTFARGAAYSTSDPVHLLNVRAANMSAFPDQPEHFSQWLAAECALDGSGLHETPVGTFVSRELFGRYLSSLVGDALDSNDGASRLRIVPDEVVDLQPEEGGYTLVLAGGRKHRVSGAVVAIGNLLPERCATSPYVENPWVTPFAEGLVPGEPVVVIGSGLTMVDVVSRLWASGFAGPVIAISRRGLLPHTHGLTLSWPPPDFTTRERRSLARLLHRVRAEIAAAQREGVGWQSVIDSLRPLTAGLWQGLPKSEQRRFLRHLRPWWDTHRHRMAPPIGQQILGLIDQDYLRLQAGRIVSMDVGAQAVDVTYRPRGQQDAVTLRAQRVINATGSSPAQAVGDPLLRKLVDRGLVQLDGHRLGIEATSRLELVGASGKVTPQLWGLGPILRGMFWECTAVPDIRRQAAQLADEIAASVAQSDALCTS